MIGILESGEIFFTDVEILIVGVVVGVEGSCCEEEEGGYADGGVEVFDHGDIESMFVKLNVVVGT